jgi:DNA uptake protein ComE-like DNA-binding protein
MPSNWIKDYLTFTKHERVAIFVLITLILAVYFLPYFLSSHPSSPTPKQIAYFDSIAGLFEQHDDSIIEERDSKTSEIANETSHAMFFFDPNTLTDENWETLGINKKTVQTIKHYLERGGHFHSAEDLQKIYGLKPEDFLRLKPYVRIASGEAHRKYAIDSSRSTHRDTIINQQFKKKEFFFVEINTSDSATLEKLPGIGNRLASRIIHFREKLGGFYTIDQVAETYGLPDSTFILLKPFLKLGTAPIKTININEADVATLRQHPYIGWPIGNAIVRFREQHGPFKSLDDLSKITIISADHLKRLIPYLSTY